MNRKYLAAPLAVMMGLGIQFIQPGDVTLGELPGIGMQSAEAGMFDAIGDSLAKTKDKVIHKSKDQANQAVKQQVNNLLHVDVGGMSHKKQRVIYYLALSAGYEQSSALGLCNTIGMEPQKVKAMNDMVYSFNNSRSSFTGSMANAKAISNVQGPSEADIKLKVDAIMKNPPSGEKLTQMQNMMKSSNRDRKMAATFNTLAAADTASILKDTAKALAHSKNLGDQLNTVQDFSNFAKMAKSVLDGQRSMSKMRGKYAAQLSRKLNVPDVTKEAEAKADSMKLG